MEWPEITFKKCLIVFELCSVGYFVYSNPELCMQIAERAPMAARAVAHDPKILLRFLHPKQVMVDAQKELAKMDVKGFGGTTNDSKASLEEIEQTISSGAAPQVATPTKLVAADSTTGVQSMGSSGPHTHDVAPDMMGAANPAMLKSDKTSQAQTLPTRPVEATVAAPVATPVATPQPQVVEAQKSVKQMSDYDSALESAYAMADSRTSAPAVPAPTPLPQKTTVLQIEHQQAATQYLHLIVRDATLRFHVTFNMNDKDLLRVVEALKNACLKSGENDLPCNPHKQSTVAVDRRFFADLKQAEVNEFSPGGVPASGLVWRLTCASGKDDCLSTSSRTRAFKITEAKALPNEIVLARGFESRVPKFTMHRQPASASRTVQRAYLTNLLSNQTSASHAGTIVDR